ncbi:MAG: deoxyribonucleoside regulator [Thermosediminibacterales bacterium]|nr:deoxyribonucleoside regulator [Thermosediminibacterales bacterium]
MDNNDIRLITRAAHMYYDDNMTQQAISDKLGISRPAVSRLLKKAREEGIVEININSPYSFSQQERQIEKLYGLREVIIVPYYNDENIKLKKILGKAAALYLTRVIKDGDIIGVSWGTTLYCMLENLKVGRQYDVVFVSLVGGIGNTQIEVHSNQLVINFSRIFGGKGQFLHAPAIVDSIEVKKSISSDKKIREVLELGQKSNIALVGIGSPDSTTMMKAGYFSTRDIQELKEAGVIGDICSQFFDIQGRLCNAEMNQRGIGLTLDQLKKIPLVIGVAGGTLKMKSILGALRGGYLDVLVTDSKTAKFLIETGG